MKFIRNLLFTILMLTLLVASVVEMLVLFPVDSVFVAPLRGLGEWVVRHTVPTPAMKFWFWFGVFWCTLGLSCLSWALRRKTAGVEVKMEAGKVVILESAIRKYLRNSLANFPAVTLQKIDIYRQRNGLHVDLYAQVRAQANLPELENQLIEEVKRALRENLGIEELASVRFFVRDFHVGIEPPLVAPRTPAETETSMASSASPTQEPERDMPYEIAAAWSREEPEAQPVETSAAEEPASEKGEEIATTVSNQSRSGFFGFWRKKKEQADAAGETSTAEPTPAESPQEDKDTQPTPSDETKSS